MHIKQHFLRIIAGAMVFMPSDCMCMQLAPSYLSFSQNPFKKIAHCIIGNDDTCTPEEIMAFRMGMFIGAMGYIRYRRLVRERVLERIQRERVDRMTPRRPATIDLDRIRQEETARGGDRQSRSWGFFEFFMDALFRKPIKHMREDDKAKLERQWNQFLSRNDLPEAENKECLCCTNDLEEKPEMKLGHIPCDNLHSEQVCLECLSTIIQNKQPCPLCRNTFSLTS